MFQNAISNSKITIEGLRCIDHNGNNCIIFAKPLTSIDFVLINNVTMNLTQSGTSGNIYLVRHVDATTSINGANSYVVSNSAITGSVDRSGHLNMFFLFFLGAVANIAEKLSVTNTNINMTSVTGSYVSLYLVYIFKPVTNIPKIDVKNSNVIAKVYASFTIYIRLLIAVATSTDVNELTFSSNSIVMTPHSTFGNSGVLDVEAVYINNDLTNVNFTVSALSIIITEPMTVTGDSYIYGVFLNGDATITSSNFSITDFSITGSLTVTGGDLEVRALNVVSTTINSLESLHLQRISMSDGLTLSASTTLGLAAASFTPSKRSKPVPSSP